MIKLRNYNKENTYIIIESDKNYKIVNKNDISSFIRDGVGGFSGDDELVAIYVKDGRLFFRYENNEYKATPNDLKCTNSYVKKGIRNFKVIIKNKVICDITYEPFIDPGMIYYDADFTEFDFLLYLSSEILKDEKTISCFIESMIKLKNRDK